MDTLKKLTKKKYIILTKNGNKAIKEALKILNKEITLIQDQGGWLTYKQFPKKTIEIKTKEGILDLKDLEKKANKNSVLLINSLSGYFVDQPMKKIEKICKGKRCKIINDISGSIGTNLAKYGDITICSFNKWKPINLGYGGFIALNKKINLEDSFDKTKLNKKLKNLDKRLKKLHEIANKVKKDLNKYNIVYKSCKNALVVVVKYSKEKEKNEIIKYCRDHKLEYTLCPRYIRINKKAVSIEIKRK